MLTGWDRGATGLELVNVNVPERFIRLLPGGPGPPPSSNQHWTSVVNIGL